MKYKLIYYKIGKKFISFIHLHIYVVKLEGFMANKKTSNPMRIEWVRPFNLEYFSFV